MQPLGILLIDDHPIVSLGVETLLKKVEGFQWLGAVSTAEEALQKVRDLHPSIILLDLVLEGFHGLTMIGDILKESPDARIIVYSSLEEDRFAPEALKAGAKGFVAKRSGFGALLTAIQCVAAGDLYASEPLKLSLINGHFGKRSGNSVQHILSSLSNQEVTVFRLLGTGLNTAEIALRLNLSVKTVGTYRERIKNKLNLHTARELERSAEAFFQDELLASKGVSPGQ